MENREITLADILSESKDEGTKLMAEQIKAAGDVEIVNICINAD